MPQQPVHQQASPYSRTVTLLLCMFLGTWGIHRFYTGNAGLGILYLLTFGVLGFGPFIDFWLILFGSLRDGQGRLVVTW